MEGKLAIARPFGYQLDVRYHPYNLRYLALLRHLKLQLQLQLPAPDPAQYPAQDPTPAPAPARTRVLSPYLSVPT